MQESMEANQTVAGPAAAVERATVSMNTEAIANWAKIIHQHADSAEMLADRLGNGVSSVGACPSEPAPPPYGLVGAGVENLDELRRAEERLEAALRRIAEAIG